MTPAASGTVEISADRVVAAATAAERLADQLAPVRLAPPLEQLSDATGGSRCHLLALELAQTWTHRVHNLAVDVERHAIALRAAVHHLGHTDAAVAAHLGHR